MITAVPRLPESILSSTFSPQDNMVDGVFARTSLLSESTSVSFNHGDDDTDRTSIAKTSWCPTPESAMTRTVRLRLTGDLPMDLSLAECVMPTQPPLKAAPPWISTVFSSAC